MIILPETISNYTPEAYEFKHRCPYRKGRSLERGIKIFGNFDT
jgi:hypothetical protein